MTEKRKYEKPSQRVIKLRHKTHLLQASRNASVSATMENEWDEEDL